MIEPRCPSCQAALPKMPQRKSKCKACGKFIHVKRTPDDRTPRLMTAAQVEEAEALWVRHSVEGRAAMDAQTYGLTADTVQRDLIRNGWDRSATIRGMLGQRAIEGDRMAIHGMLASAAPSDRRHWFLALLEADLARFRAAGFSDVEVRTETTMARRCSACEPLHLKVVPSTTSASEIAPSTCERDHCTILVTPCITYAATGSFRFERSEPFADEASAPASPQPNRKSWWRRLLDL